MRGSSQCRPGSAWLSYRLSRLSGWCFTRDGSRRGDVLDFVSDRSEEVAPATVNRSVAVLKNMFTFAIEKEYIDAHPLIRFKMLPEDEVALRVMELPEERALVETTLREDIVIGAYVGILGETGLRKTGALLLKRHFVNLNEGVLTVEASKNRKTRQVPLTRYAMDLFHLLYEVRPEGTYCFVKEDGQRWKEPREPFDVVPSSTGRTGNDSADGARTSRWPEICGTESVARLLQAHGGNYVMN